MILVAKTSDLGAYMRHTGYSKKTNKPILIFRRWGLLFGRLVDLRCLI